MGRKLTGKQEAFAVGVAKGLTQADAYRAAYDVKQGRDATKVGQEAAKVAKVPHVKARIAELRKRVRAKVQKILIDQEIAPPPAKPEDVAVEATLQTRAIDTAAAVFENARIGFSDIRRVLAADGTMKPPAEWDADMAAAVASIKVRELFGEGKDGKGVIGQTVEIKLWDKGAALDRLGKHLGMYEKDNVQKAANPFEGLPRERVKAILEALARERRPRLG